MEDNSTTASESMTIHLETEHSFVILLQGSTALVSSFTLTLGGHRNESMRKWESPLCKEEKGGREIEETRQNEVLFADCGNYWLNSKAYWEFLETCLLLLARSIILERIIDQINGGENKKKSSQIDTQTRKWFPTQNMILARLLASITWPIRYSIKKRAPGTSIGEESWQGNMREKGWKIILANEDERCQMDETSSVRFSEKLTIVQE